jgi:putative ABC transport system substrate-binding protein
MKRREFITLLGGAAAAWPLVARAQQAERMRRVGVMISLAENDPEAQARADALRQGLEVLGWKDGNNIRIEYRWAVSDSARARIAAKELLSLAPDLLVPASTPMLAAVRQETSSVPIVFVNISDPVGSGFVDSLVRPGGNVTGFTNFEYSIGTKWLEMLKQVSPRLSRVAIIANPKNPTTVVYLNSIEPSGPSFGLQVSTASISDGEIERTIATFAHEPNGGLIVLPEPNTSAQRELIVALADRYRLPAIYPYRFFAEAGGLMAYGTDTGDLYRRSASYVDRILKGTNPAHLPVQQPTKFEFVINLKTAKTLGLEVPQTLLAIADEVIE